MSNLSLWAKKKKLFERNIFPPYISPSHFQFCFSLKSKKLSVLCSIFCINPLYEPYGEPFLCISFLSISAFLNSSCIFSLVLFQFSWAVSTIHLIYILFLWLQYSWIRSKFRISLSVYFNFLSRMFTSFFLYFFVIC